MLRSVSHFLVQFPVELCCLYLSPVLVPLHLPSHPHQSHPWTEHLAIVPPQVSARTLLLFPERQTRVLNRCRQTPSPPSCEALLPPPDTFATATRGWQVVRLALEHYHFWALSFPGFKRAAAAFPRGFAAAQTPSPPSREALLPLTDTFATVTRGFTATNGHPSQPPPCKSRHHQNPLPLPPPPLLQQTHSDQLTPLGFLLLLRHQNTFIHRFVWTTTTFAFRTHTLSTPI